MAKLTPKQQRFIKEYLIDLNAAHAAIRAGYSKKTAAVIGAQNLIKFNKEIQAEISKRNNRIEISQDRVLREAARIALFDPRKFYDADGNLIPIHKLDDDSAAVIAGMDIEELYEGKGSERVSIGRVRKIKLANKALLIDKLFQHLGLYEKDNKQKASALSDLLTEIAGSTRGLPNRTQEKIKE